MQELKDTMRAGGYFVQTCYVVLCAMHEQLITIFRPFSSSHAAARSKPMVMIR